jgi:hypothetical protein
MKSDSTTGGGIGELTGGLDLHSPLFDFRAKVIDCIHARIYNQLLFSFL